MPTLTLTITAEADGRPIDDSPLVLTATGAVARTLSLSLAAGGGLTILPLFTDLRDLELGVVTVSGPCTVFLNGQSGKGMPLLAGGVLAFGPLTDCDGFPLLAVLNTGDEACRVRGIVLGTAIAL